MSPSPDRPLNDAERDRMDAMLSRFRGESAMNNAEQIDGFFAALICSPEIAKPSQYLPEIWGGEMADEEAFDDQHQFQDFLSLLMRHWNSIVCILEKGEISCASHIGPKTSVKDWRALRPKIALLPFDHAVRVAALNRAEPITMGPADQKPTMTFRTCLNPRSPPHLKLLCGYNQQLLLVLPCYDFLFAWDYYPVMNVTVEAIKS